MTDLPPGKSLVFLLHDVARLYRRRMDQRAQSLGLTSAQWRVLASIARTELLNQEPLNQATLAELMDMEPITVSRHVDRMEAAGMIERRPDPADRRAHKLFLTEAARPLVNSFRTLGSGCVADALAGISEAEIETVTDVLSRIRTNILAMADDAEPAKPEAKTARKVGQVA